MDKGSHIYHTVLHMHSKYFSLLNAPNGEWMDHRKNQKPVLTHCCKSIGKLEWETYMKNHCSSVIAAS